MRTVIGFFSGRPEAENAAAALEHEGFARADIGMLAHERRTAAETPAIGPVHEVGSDSETGTDAAIGAMAGTVAGMVLALIPGIGPLLAIGPLAIAIGGMGVGAAAGALVGVIRDLGVSEEEARYYAEGIRRGGAVVSLSTRNEDVARAERVLKNAGGIDIQERAREWREAGWGGYDPNAEAYPETRKA